MWKWIVFGIVSLLSFSGGFAVNEYINSKKHDMRLFLMVYKDDKDLVNIHLSAFSQIGRAHV